MQPSPSCPPGTEEQLPLLDYAPVLIWISGLDQRRTWFNRPWLQFTGRTMEQELGDGWAEGVHPDDLDHCREVSATAFDARQPFRAEYRLRRHDGQYRWVLDSGVPRSDATGQFLGYIGSCTDITEQKEAQENAQNQQELLQMTLASIGDAVITTNPEGRVGFLNGVAERLTGWGQADAAGVPLETVFSIVNEETRRTVENPALRALREGVIMGLANHTVLIARDGVERAIDDSAAPIRDARGRVNGAVLIFRDVTERRRAEQAHSRLAAIVEAAEDAIISKTLDGTITSWNAAAERMYGYRAEEVIGHPITLLTPPEVAEDVPRILERIKRGERIEHYETVRMRKDGTCLAVSLSISPIRNASGQIIGASKIARDIREQKALREELERRVEELAAADRRKDQFLAMLAHELRNPLGAISTAAHVLQQPQGTEVAKQRAVEVLRRQVQHQARMVNDLLDVSRITRGLIELRRERLDLGRLVRDAAEDYRAALEQECIGLCIELPQAPLWVVGDATRLTQVVSNLLSNAQKFTPAGGQITIRVEANAPASQAVLTITDTGIGIEPELLPQVFDSFSQGDRTLARSQGGLGLGLAIVKGLVQLHGGEVSAESAGPGQGSTMRVTLPLPEPSREAAPERAKSRSASASLRVLIIEDNQDAAEMLKDLLEMHGHEVKIALSGPEGVRAAREYQPDVVLCDIGLPGMDGYEVATMLRSDPITASQRLVAASGYGQEEDRRRSREAGFDEHLVKPIEPEELNRVLLALMDERDG